MTNHNRLELVIDQLLLDTKNPRYEELFGQEAALKEMVDDQGEKLVALAEDIVQNGLNPADVIIVTEDENSDKYIVLEGNRRLSALKLLHDPELIKVASVKSLRDKLTVLTGKVDLSTLETIECVEFSSREAAAHWLELRHRGENKGRGIVSWDGQATDRFRERISGEKSREKQVIEYARERLNLPHDVEEGLSDLPITNLQRLLGDPDVRREIGLEIVKGRVLTKLESGEVNKPLTKIITDLTRGTVTVSDIKRKQNRGEYIASFKKEAKPDHSKTAAGAWPLDEPSKEKKPKKKTTTSPTPIPTKRTYLIPSTCILQIHHPRLNRVYHELRKMSPAKLPNATAVLFRVFVELSLEEFNNKVKGAYKHKGTLVSKINKAADYLDDQGILNQNELKPVRVAVSKKDHLMNTNTLNAYVHNPSMQPIAEDLKTTWDGFQPFIEAIYRTII